MKNKIKNTEESNVKQKKSSNGFFRALGDVFSGGFVRKENVVTVLPYLFFLTVLGLVYIANGYYAQGTVRSLYKVGNELKELRSEYITIKSDLNFISKQSQVAIDAEKHGVLESVTPPSKIMITKKEAEQIQID